MTDLSKCRAGDLVESKDGKMWQVYFRQDDKAKLVAREGPLGHLDFDDWIYVWPHEYRNYELVDES